jgi:hypothetical protein
VEEVLVALTVLLLTTVLLFVFGVTYTRWWLRKQLRLRPSTRSTAPTSWLVSTSEPARLHRRLRKATTTARLAGVRGGPTIAELVSELEDHAIALEAHLVMTSRVWRREREVRIQLVKQVGQVEQLASRLTVISLEAGRPRTLSAGSTDALAELTERIDSLDAARAELVELERTWDLN